MEGDDIVIIIFGIFFIKGFHEMGIFHNGRDDKDVGISEF
jgi:hypothetical protein